MINAVANFQLMTMTVFDQQISICFFSANLNV